MMKRKNQNKCYRARVVTLVIAFRNIYVGVYFRMSHFVFLRYLVSKLVLLKVNQNIMIPNFERMEAKDEIFQFFWSGFNSSK